MGFVDFLLQDDDPEKRSVASSSVRSNHMSGTSHRLLDELLTTQII